ncbi:MAG: hypothetical protein ACK52I_19230 [Pseudomonadota bacterium]
MGKFVCAECDATYGDDGHCGCATAPAADAVSVTGAMLEAYRLGYDFVIRARIADAVDDESEASMYREATRSGIAAALAARDAK